MPTLYPWERRWREIAASKAINESYHQVESTGYVAAGVLTDSLRMQPIGVRLSDVDAERQVIVLLGEPGSGKSSEWRRLREELTIESQHLFLNLGEFATEAELREAILEDPKVVSWQQSGNKLTLWLDSLDEGLLHMRKLQKTLLRILQKLLPLERINLRITCRNAIWPVTFTEELGSLWGFGQQPSSEQLSVLLLRPLTQEQVAEAAQVEGLPSEEFLAAAAALDAQPLASIPVTLRLLLALYKKYGSGFGGSESAGRAGLFELGCLQLCEASGGEREEPYRMDRYERLLLAGYLAYLAIFSNRRQILIEPAVGELEENSLDPHAAGARQTVSWKGLRVAISTKAIQNLLKNTSLFIDLGNGSLVWAHQAFAEFLAAWYLNLANISLGSTRALFRSEADPAGGVVPALRETAAWLAELRPAFWQELLRLDPLALVRSDLRQLRPEQQADVVQQLVVAMSTLSYPPYQENGFMQQLCHSGLAAQLEPLLTGEEVPTATVRFAMDMAKECSVQLLVPVLIEQALDVTQPFYKRAHALNILRVIIPDEAKPALRSLIHGIPDEDERDEFRGYLLWILWPDYLAPDELLPLLTPDKDDSYGGAYRHFIHYLERQDIHFSAQAVRNSLYWLSKNWSALAPHHRLPDFWAWLSLLIWRRAWQVINEPGVSEAATAAFATGIEHHEYISVRGASDEARLQLLKILLAKHYKTIEWFYVIPGFNRQEALLTQADWDRLFPLIQNRLVASQREWLAKVLRRLLVISLYNEPSNTYCRRYEQFLTAARRYASVRAVWQEWFKPVDYQSQEAEKDRKEWQQVQKRTRKEIWQKKNRRRVTLHKISLQAQKMRQLVQYDVERACRPWMRFLNSLQSDKTGKNTYRQNVNPGESKHWKKLAANLKNSVLDRLWEFIEQHPAPPASWYGPGNHTTCGAEVLRQGLELLFSQRNELIRSQSPQFWQNLAPFLVRFDESAHDDLRRELLHLTAVHALEEADDAIVLGMAARDDREHGSFDRFKDWYRWLPMARFPALLLQSIGNGVWNEGLSGQVLVAMLEVDYAPAWKYVRELLSVPLGRVIERPKLTMLLFGSLLFRKENLLLDVWQYWKWLFNHPDIARLVINAEIDHPTPREFTYLTGLQENELEALIRWLTRTFDLLPTDVDDWGNDNPRGKYAGLRTAAAAELADRGTATAWQQLKRLAEELRQPYWLRVRLDQVRENLRRNAWVPAQPEELIELSQQTGKQLVKSAADLQELIVASLCRFQANMHNELVMANLMWIPQKQGNKQVGHAVRDENTLCDILRSYLHLDLQRPEVLIKREVEIRRSVGAGTGQRTDLFIDAFTRDKHSNKTERVTVVIEVKLSKNPEAETALVDQLLPYLADQPYKHGIYLVGWHYGQFDPPPTSRKDLVALHQLLQQQTANLPSGYFIKSLILDIRLAADNARKQDPIDLFEAI